MRLRACFDHELALPDETIVRQGDRGTNVFFISSGAVEVILPEENMRLVPRHSDYDSLKPGQISSGRCFGSTSTSMLRATLGCLLMKPARSSVNTIW